MSQADGRENRLPDGVDKPSFLEKQRVRYRWFDHIMEAASRYQSSKGDYFAAGTTYFSVFALFPLLMIGFATAGFVFANNPELLDKAKDKIADSADGSMGEELTDLMDQAIASRATIGVLGLLIALYAGLGWMANLRMALTVQWGPEPEKAGVVKTKLADLGALLGLFLAMVVTFALSALSSSSFAHQVLEWLHADDLPGVSWALRGVSLGALDHRVVASVHLGDRQTATGRVTPAQRVEGRFAHRGGVRDLQTGREHLPPGRRERPRRCHVRSDPGHHGLRLHHHPDRLVRHRVGGDRSAQPQVRGHTGSGSSGHQPARRGPRRTVRARSRRGCRCRCGCGIGYFGGDAAQTLMLKPTVEPGDSGPLVEPEPGVDQRHHDQRTDETDGQLGRSRQAVGGQVIGRCDVVTGARRV